MKGKTWPRIAKLSTSIKYLKWQKTKQIEIYIPVCPWVAHLPGERNNRKHPSERLPLREKQRYIFTIQEIVYFIGLIILNRAF